MTAITPGATPQSDPDDGAAVMDLLRHHVPLSLIVDLSSAAGPHSHQLLVSEGRPRSPWWAPESARPSGW